MALHRTFCCGNGYMVFLPTSPTATKPVERPAPDQRSVVEAAIEMAIHELISSRNMEELWDLFNNMDENRE